MVPHFCIMAMSLHAGKLSEIALLARISFALQMILEHYAKGIKLMPIFDIKAKAGKASPALTKIAMEE